MGGQLFEDAKQLKAFSLRPEDVVIIGVDEGGTGHALYDPRVKTLHKTLTPEFLDDIATHGVLETIEVVKDDQGRALCVFGRRRVLAAREVNKRLVAAGKKPVITVPARSVTRGTSDREMMQHVLSENSHRVDDEALVAAEKAAYYLKINGDDAETQAECARSLNLSPQRLTRLLAYREARPEVHKAVREGTMGLEAGLALAALPKSQQTQSLAKVQAEALADGEKRVSAERARREKVGGTPKPHQALVRKVLAELETEMPPELLGLVKWVLGDAGEDQLDKVVRIALGNVRAAKKGDKA